MWQKLLLNQIPMFTLRNAHHSPVPGPRPCSAGSWQHLPTAAKASSEQSLPGKATGTAMATHGAPFPVEARTPRSSALGGGTILSQKTPDPLEPHSKGKVSEGDNYLNEVPAEVSSHLELVIEMEFSPLTQEVCKLKVIFPANSLISAKIKCKSWGICQLAH